MRKGRFYLGRIIKLGRLTQNMLVDAIIDSPVVSTGKYAWAITDAIDMRQATPSFIYGELSKFTFKGSVKVVDLKKRSKIDEATENLWIASSPFVYLPEFSGIAYLHVWNQIQDDVFPRRFQSIIEEAYGNFFVECKVEAVSDYSSFVSKMGSFERYTQITAKVHPPNPLFGRLWESLEEYIQERNVDEYSVKETSPDEQGINTDISSLMQGLIANRDYIPKCTPSLTDAALLMAADGYGKGKAVGVSKGEPVEVRTTETKKSFLFDKTPEPDPLARKTHQEFEDISKDRDMQHP